jgi:hypothetical protein
MANSIVAVFPAKNTNPFRLGHHDAPDSSPRAFVACGELRYVGHYPFCAAITAATTENLVHVRINTCLSLSMDQDLNLSEVIKI